MLDHAGSSFLARSWEAGPTSENLAWLERARRTRKRADRVRSPDGSVLVPETTTTVGGEAPAHGWRSLSCQRGVNVSGNWAQYADRRRQREVARRSRCHPGARRFDV